MSNALSYHSSSRSRRGVVACALAACLALASGALVAPGAMAETVTTEKCKTEWNRSGAAKTCKDGLQVYVSGAECNVKVWCPIGWRNKKFYNYKRTLYGDFWKLQNCTGVLKLNNC